MFCCRLMPRPINGVSMPCQSACASAVDLIERHRRQRSSIDFPCSTSTYRFAISVVEAPPSVVPARSVNSWQGGRATAKVGPALTFAQFYPRLGPCVSFSSFEDPFYARQRASPSQAQAALSSKEASFILIVSGGQDEVSITARSALPRRNSSGTPGIEHRRLRNQLPDSSPMAFPLTEQLCTNQLAVLVRIRELEVSLCTAT